MKSPYLSIALAASLLLGSFSTKQLSAQKAAKAPTIRDAYKAHGTDLKVYDEHLTFLASPFLEGRLPGTRGMEIAKDYVQHFFMKAGLQPPFASGQSWRQDFPLRGVRGVVSSHMRIGEQQLVAGQDFHALSLGAGGQAKGELVFVGYGIQKGAGSYSSFAEGDDLTGKIAVCLRFEPMDASGKSKWVKRARWGMRAGFAYKMRSLLKLNPSAILFVNPPGAADPRAKGLMAAATGGRTRGQLPVFALSDAAAEHLVKAYDPQQRSLMQLRILADEGRVFVPLGVEGDVSAKIGFTGTKGQNIGGLLPGKGALADEIVVIGAHLDHLGMGQFGSRSGGGELHPGADDNASGVAAILMIAEKLRKEYDAMPAEASARSILFLAFSGEESGLNGSRYYTRHPIAAVAKHAIMLNFDMIGRIQNGGLSVSGTGTAKGMMTWLKPVLDRSPLDLKVRKGVMAASDHFPFHQAQIPTLFAIVSPIHGDYHTPRDTADKINRVDAVHAMRLYKEIGLAAATRQARFEFARGGQQQQRQRRRGRSAVRVSFGIRPGSYDADEQGVFVGGVTPGSPAEKGGLEKGDRMVEWNGKPIGNVMSWMRFLLQAKPGDRVKVTVLRNGKKKVLEVTLQGRRR
ncbi:MAG: hypothetical protein CSA62_07600 [Planctomycetota bacterium]|nr:MAG: hypothetical protein CSA62_07600 [Planctomycetota bacterium]